MKKRCLGARTDILLLVSCHIYAFSEDDQIDHAHVSRTAECPLHLYIITLRYSGQTKRSMCQGRLMFSAKHPLICFRESVVFY